VSISMVIDDKARFMSETEQLRAALDRVTRAAWRLSNWNDMNFSAEDLSAWRAQVRDACREAEPYLIHPGRPLPKTDDDV